jgi:hypothetical protein
MSWSLKKTDGRKVASINTEKNTEISKRNKYLESENKTLKLKLNALLDIAAVAKLDSVKLQINK